MQFGCSFWPGVTSSRRGGSATMTKLSAAPHKFHSLKDTPKVFTKVYFACLFLCLFIFNLVSASCLTGYYLFVCLAVQSVTSDNNFSRHVCLAYLVLSAIESSLFFPKFPRAGTLLNSADIRLRMHTAKLDWLPDIALEHLRQESNAASIRQIVLIQLINWVSFP